MSKGRVESGVVEYFGDSDLVGGGVVLKSVLGRALGPNLVTRLPVDKTQ